MKVLTLFLNFLPMAIIYLIATYSPQVARFSHTCLGKVVALGLILIYSFFDIISGLLVCALIIFYYQSDYVESFQHDSLKEGLESQDSEDTEDSKETKDTNDSKDTKDSKDADDSKDSQDKNEENPIDGVFTTEQPSSTKDTSSKSSESPEKNSEKPSDKPSKKSSEKKGAPEPPTSTPTTETFETLADAYPLPIEDSNLYDKHTDMFRQNNCSNGRLMNKGQVVKPEMAEHIFPGIEQDPYHKCNVCDSSCKFKYTPYGVKGCDNRGDNKGHKGDNWYIIKGIELDLIKPKSSNDEYDNEMKKYHK
jgi:hypothetical protein